MSYWSDTNGSYVYKKTVLIMSGTGLIGEELNCMGVSNCWQEGIFMLFSLTHCLF